MDVQEQVAGLSILVISVLCVRKRLFVVTLIVICGWKGLYYLVGAFPICRPGRTMHTANCGPLR